MIWYVLNLSINFLSYCYQKSLDTYCGRIYKREEINYFWSMNDNTWTLDKLNGKGFYACISAYDFSTLYSTLPHDLLKSTY